MNYALSFIGGFIGGLVAHQVTTILIIENRLKLYSQRVSDALKRFDLRVKHCESHIKKALK